MNNQGNFWDNPPQYDETIPPPSEAYALPSDDWDFPDITDDPEEDIIVLNDTSFDPMELSLDDDQVAVVYHPLKKNARVVAGPGAGKTRTIICRVAKLVRDGMNPSRILLLTFTRKASGEMMRRCREQIGERGRWVCGGTFHSFCMKLLQKHWNALYPERPTLIGDAVGELIGMAKERMCDHLGLEKTGLWRSDDVYKILSKHVNTGISLVDLLKRKPDMWIIPPGAPEKNMDLTVRAFEVMRREFAAIKKYYNKLDYDDVLLFGVELFQRCPDILAQWKARFQQIIVDEHQDTNPIQQDLLVLLENKNVMVVGDEHQSLYKFRGASAELFFSFEELFNATTYFLNRNYRSTEQIVMATNTTLKKSSMTIAGKHLQAVRPEQIPVTLFAGIDQFDEADWIMTQIENARCHGIPLRDIAVLYRSSTSAIPLELNLKRSNYAYRKVGGARFNEGVHIKDMLALLAIKVYPTDRYSWERAFEILPGIGKKTAQKYADIRLTKGHEGFATLSSKALLKLSPLVDLLSRYDQQTYPECLPMLWEWYKGFQKWDDHEVQYREFGAKYLFDYAQHTPSLAKFLDELMIDPVKDPDDDDQDKLTLSTIHGAKGLEWPIVFVIDLVQGRLPSVIAEDYEQELNAFYVAISRPKNFLILTHGKGYRTFEGEYKRTAPSIFLDDIDRIELSWESNILELAA